ncbi:proliferating cell nuclear antigen (pcna) [Anncaliia algerae PRA339]|uniref:DNA sliding clamp PCNA n=1 Tax=Anncaliia algerae PRA339 TaxID=1288291 RepID=A0A059F3P3_9MICR|nr:proliferating cell nuclear antigen (pcna) [Anncaliia algerae PRA339]
MFELKIQASESDSSSKFNAEALNLLKKAIEVVHELVEDADIQITDKGINIQALDNIHVCLINIFLSKNLFFSYRCDKNLVLGIKLKVLNKIMKTIKVSKNDVFELNCEDDGNVLSLKYESSRYVLSNDFKLYKFDIESYTLPSMDYTASITFNLEDFMLLSKSVGTFDEFIVFDAKKDSFTFNQVSDVGKSSLVLKPNDENGVVVNVSDPICKEISMKYINIMSKLQGLSDKVSIHIGENHPIFFEFSMEEYGYIRFYVAAKKDDH